MAQIDQFQYAYNANTNQLNYVNDLMGASVMGTDLASQSAGNYAYDAIGQLISDQQEDLATIEWKVTGKVDKITKANGDIIDFVYDAMGNRIIKKDIPSDGVGETHTYYVRDAQGNVMSIYKYNPSQSGVGGLANNLYLYERNIYGSSRIGMEQVQQVIATSAPNQANWINSENQNTNAHAWFNQKIGDKRFELANHLGNVLEVITDRKISIDFGVYDVISGNYTSNNSDGIIDYYSPDVISQNDYYPFACQSLRLGMLLPNRHESSNEYRYGYQGQEKDYEIKGEGNSLNYKYRMHDPRVGRFFAVDPLTSQYPHYTPYSFSGNKLIAFRELEGLEETSAIFGAGITANISSKLKLSHVRGNLNASLNVGSGKTQGNFSAGISFYTGGLGTIQGTYANGHKQSLNIEGNASAGITYGTGNGSNPNQLPISNYYQGSGLSINNSFKSSGFAGVNGTLTLYRKTRNFEDARGRNQLSGYFGFQKDGLSASNYNDLFVFSGDDSFWTGGFDIQYRFNTTTGVALTYDAFTGKRPSKNAQNERPSFLYKNNRYYGGKGKNSLLYNNAQTSLKFNSNIFSASIGHTGNGRFNSQWLQNGIHSVTGGYRFYNVSKESVTFGFEAKPKSVFE